MTERANVLIEALQDRRAAGDELNMEATAVDLRQAGLDAAEAGWVNVEADIDKLKGGPGKVAITFDAANAMVDPLRAHGGHQPEALARRLVEAGLSMMQVTWVLRHVCGVSIGRAAEMAEYASTPNATGDCLTTITLCDKGDTAL